MESFFYGKIYSDGYCSDLFMQIIVINRFSIYYVCGFGGFCVFVTERIFRSIFSLVTMAHMHTL